MNSKLTRPSLASAALLLFATPLLAQTSGISHPETIEGPVTTTGPVNTDRKPSPAIPMAQQDALDSYAPSVTPASTPTPVSAPTPAHYVPRVSAPVAPSAQEQSPVLHTHAAEPAEAHEGEATRATTAPHRSLEVTEDINSGIVTDVPSRPGELHSGSLLRARLQTRLSTADSPIGTNFTARLEVPVQRRGEVLLPVGTVLKGRVADVHGGSRLRGGALLRLQPDSVTLPDGTVHALSADLIDLGNGADRDNDQRVDSEGTVHQRSHPKRDLSAAGLATGSGAVAGALVGGGIGAAVGAGIGAGISTVVWLRRDQQTVLPAGTMLVFSLNEPLTLRASAF